MKHHRDDPGAWAWVLNRISGAAIFFFLIVHVLDTALVRVSPQVYNQVVETYKTPLVVLMEIGLVAAALFHTLHGIRVIVLDSWSRGPRFERQLGWAVTALWTLLTVPATVVIVTHLVQRI